MEFIWLERVEDAVASALRAEEARGCSSVRAATRRCRRLELAHVRAGRAGAYPPVSWRHARGRRIRILGRAGGRWWKTLPPNDFYLFTVWFPVPNLWEGGRSEEGEVNEHHGWQKSDHGRHRDTQKLGALGHRRSDRHAQSYFARRHRARRGLDPYRQCSRSAYRSTATDRRPACSAAAGIRSTRCWPPVQMRSPAAKTKPRAFAMPTTLSTCRCRRPPIGTRWSRLLRREDV